MAGGVCTLDVAPAHQSSLLLALVRHAGRLAGLGLFEMTRRLIADELRTCRMPPLRSDDLDEWIEGLWAASLGTAAGRDTKAPAGKPVKVLEPEAGEWREAGVRLRQLYELLLAHPMNETPLARQLAFAQQELDAVNAMEALPADLKPPLVQALTRHRDTLRQRLKPDDADPDDLG